MTWKMTLRINETTDDIIERVLTQYKKDKKANVPSRNYIIREFAEVDSTDINGAAVPTPEVRLNPGTVSDLLLGKKGKASNATWESTRRKFSKNLGAPDLIKPNVDYPKLKVRLIEEVSRGLERYNRRATYELKSLRQICEDINEITNPRTRVAISTLNWLYNSGKGRATADAAGALWNALVAEEKDRLFYTRRHPRTPMLHSCQCDEIIEAKSHLMWYFLDKNPFNIVKKKAKKKSRPSRMKVDTNVF